MDCFRKYLVEFLGTYFLVFTAAAMILFGAGSAVTALAIGTVLAVMIYAGGYVSGGHYNPAVSLASVIRGGMCFHDLIPYWIAQILGAAAATYTVIAFAPNGGGGIECPFNTLSVLTGEFLFTFALCYTALSTTTSEETEGNSYYGAAIGGIAAAGIITVGGTLCYAAFNPAIALGLGIMGSFCPVMLLITALVNLAAGASAAIIFRFASNE